MSIVAVFWAFLFCLFRNTRYGAYHRVIALQFSEHELYNEIDIFPAGDECTFETTILLEILAQPFYRMATVC